MPPASLTTFPAEVLIRVYKSLNNVKDVTALNLASPRFHDVWRENIVSISDAVFSRTIKNYDDARELVKIQQKFVERNHCADDGHHDPYEQALRRNKLMVSNDYNFRAFYQEEERWLKFDKTLMSRSYYCVCMLALVKEDTFAQSSCLASLDLETLHFMFNLILRDLFKLNFSLENDGLNLPFPPGFDLKRIGEKSPKDSLLHIRDTLEKHIPALKMAEAVRNGVEYV